MTDFATLAIKISTDGANRANNDLRSVERASKQTEKAVDSLSITINALKRLMALGIGVQGISSLIQMADKMKSLNAQVKFVTSSIAELNAVQEELFQISQRTRSSLEATTQLYVRSARALKDYGASQQQILQFTETINKAMAVGGVGAQEQASALMQLSQALGSGRLQGDEFRTIAETAPIILDVVAEYMGKSRAEVKKLATEGKITSQLLFEAINSSTQKINKQFEGMPLTFSQAMQQMENAALKFVGDLDSAFGATNAFAQGISLLAQNLDSLALIIGGLLLAHLAKYGQSMVENVIVSYKQNAANLQLAQTAKVRASVELQVARSNMEVLASELRLAQTEQTRTAIRTRMAQQSTLIASLTNSEAVANNNLAAAQTRASIAGRALSGVMGLLGGPAGVITLAAGALFYFYEKSEQAKAAALDTAAANDRLKQSYEDLSKSALTKTVYEQLDLLKKSDKQISSLKGQLATLQMPDSFSGEISASAEELQKLNDEIQLMEETKWINTQALEKQIHQLGLRFLESGERLNVFREKMKIAGVNVDLLNNVLSTQEFQIASVKSEFQGLFPKIDATKISYDGLNLVIGTFSVKADLAAIKALELAGALGSVIKGALMASVAVSNMNNALGGDAVSEGLKKEFDKIESQKRVLALLKKGDKLGAYKEEARQSLLDSGHKADEVGFASLVDEKANLKLAQEGFKEFQSEMKKSTSDAKKYSEEWTQHYDELYRASADGLTRIALEQERAMHEMLEKAKKANVGAEEIERAKNLIYERYAKERQEIAEQYAPELKHKRELKEQLLEIQQLKQLGKLTGPQADKASNTARWNAGEAIAKQAGYDAVDGFDRWKEQFDPMQAIKNEQVAKTAELKSLYDQNLIQYEDFINAKAQIDAKATADTQNLFMDSIAGFGSAIDTMLGVMKNAGMEQSGIYKTMFAVSKAFAIADSIIKIQQGIANAASLPFPQNLGAMATVASNTASIISTIQGTNLKGMAHDGIDNIPREGTWLLDKGERVVDSRTNADLKKFLSSQNNQNRSNGKSVVNVKIINNGQPVNAQVESNETADGVELTVTLLSKMEDVANKVYTKRQAQDIRPGGFLRRQNL